MKSNVRRVLSACAGIAVLSLTVAMADKAASPAKAKLGEKAPSWTLTDMDGKEFKFEDYKGKTLIMEWFNPECPYVVGIYEKGMPQETWKAIQKLGDGYAYLLVNSTADGVTKEQVIERSRAFLKKHKFEAPVLIDYDGTVGKAYGATNTPQAYITDGEQILRYNGAYSSDSRQKDPNATNYVLNAVTQLKAGETVTPDYEKPWGCSVKYKD